MYMNAKGRRLLLPTLTGVLLGCLTMRARGDDIDYLPDRAHLVVSVNFQDALKSKAFDELNKKLKEQRLRERDIAADMTSGLGIPAASIVRITTSMSMRIVTTHKPVTAAAIIAARKVSRNVTFKEIQVGSFTIHEENQDAKNPRGDSFCVIEDKTFLFGSTDGLRKVLQRNGKPELSANMQIGLKHAGFSNTAFAVIDTPAPEHTEIFGVVHRVLVRLGRDGLKGGAEKPQTLVAQLNLREKLSASATIFYGDAAGAAEFRKNTEVTLNQFKEILKDTDPKRELLPLFEVIRVSTKVNQVRVEATTDAARAVGAIGFLDFILNFMR